MSDDNSFWATDEQDSEKLKAIKQNYYQREIISVHMLTVLFVSVQ
jgi:hypothetical protein